MKSFHPVLWTSSMIRPDEAQSTGWMLFYVQSNFCLRIILLYYVTLISIYDVTLFGYVVFVLRCHQEVFDGLAPCIVNLYAMFLAHILKLSLRPFMYGTVMQFLPVLDVELLSVTFFFLFLLLLDWTGALILFFILFKTHLGYLHVVRTFCRCSCSSSSCCLVEHTSIALWSNALMTLYLADMAWWLSLYRYWLVWVGFLYTVVSNLPSACGMTRVFRKGIEWSALVLSAVNCMPSSMELICVKNSSLWADFMTTKVSSANVFHKLGVCGAVLRALASNSSINVLATMGLNGGPIAAPSICS